MQPDSTVLESTATGANPLGATSFARCGDVQYCSDDHVPVLHPVQGSTLLIDADCGLGKTTAIRRYMSELFASNSQARSKKEHRLHTMPTA